MCELVHLWAGGGQVSGQDEGWSGLRLGWEAGRQ